jgi:hypothetical protein
MEPGEVHAGPCTSVWQVEIDFLRVLLAEKSTTVCMQPEAV